MLQKAIVIGCPGSGKTTFSEKLRDRTGLSLYYLDAVWHKPDRTHIAREDFDRRLTQILGADQWIIDGNYSRTLEMRLQHCDTVFLFDLPTEVCLQGAIDRLGKGRYDMPWIDTQLDPGFQAEIENFRETKLPGIYQLLDAYKDGRQIIVFHTRQQADTWLERLG